MKKQTKTYIVSGTIGIIMGGILLVCSNKYRVEPTIIKQQETSAIIENETETTYNVDIEPNTMYFDLLSQPQYEVETVQETETVEVKTETETTIIKETETETEIETTQKEEEEETQEQIEKEVVQQNNNSNLYNDFSDYEIEMICRCVETEVYQCSFNQKVNIASVIFNRLKSDEFPNDIVSIITAPKQFAFFRTTISDDTIRAIKYAYENGDTVDNCIGFRSDVNPYSWNGWEYQFSDGVHYFYK